VSYKAQVSPHSKVREPETSVGPRLGNPVLFLSPIAHQILTYDFDFIAVQKKHARSWGEVT
jgi:hypothetical protein